MIQRPRVHIVLFFCALSSWNQPSCCRIIIWGGDNADGVSRLSRSSPVSLLAKQTFTHISRTLFPKLQAMCDIDYCHTRVLAMPRVTWVVIHLVAILDDAAISYRGFERRRPLSPVALLRTKARSRSQSKFAISRAWTSASPLTNHSRSR